MKTEVTDKVRGVAVATDHGHIDNAQRCADKYLAGKCHPALHKQTVWREVVLLAETSLEGGDR